MRRFLVLVVLGLLFSGATVACQGKGLPPAQQAAAGAEGEDGGSEGESEGSSDEPKDPKKAEEEITTNITSLFDGTKPDINQKLTYVDRADSIKEVALRVLSANADVFKIITAKVSDVKFDSPTEATVAFDILVGGSPTIQGFNGKMLYRQGAWKVDPQNLCDLIAIADAQAVCTPAPDTGGT